MIIDRSNVFDIINKANLKPDKEYGQNFLVEPEICNKIISCLDIQNNGSVLEVGPGLGSLTHFLSLNNCYVTAVDIDQRMIDFLNIVYKDSNVKIVQNDIRKVDVSSYDYIVGNLPYNITTETIQYLLLHAENAKNMVFMIQQETFSHFFDVSGKEYGPTSVLIHLLGKIERQITVKAGSFYPVPKCNSVVFTIETNPNAERESAVSAFKLAKSLFSNRRKTILNNLTNYLKNKELAIDTLNSLNLNPLLRPEQISPLKYLEISEYLSDKE